MFVIRSIIAFCLCSFFLHSAIGKTLITISKKKGGQVIARVSLKEVQSAYGHIKKLGAESAPTPKKFVNDYVRYVIGIEEAYKDKALVKDAKIKNMFANPLLKQGFEQLLYKMLAKNNWQKLIIELHKFIRKYEKAKNLSLPLWIFIPTTGWENSLFLAAVTPLTLLFTKLFPE